MSYPSIVVLGNKEYKLNTDFNIALKCFDIIDDDNISDWERTYGVIGLLFDEEIPEEYLKDALDKASLFLRCGKEETTSQVKDMDFRQDEAYILSSFIKDYKIDLSETKIHWWKFCDLISGLSEESILNRVRDLRNYDISKIKDVTERNKIMKAKQNVALKEKLSNAEQEAFNEFESLFK